MKDPLEDFIRENRKAFDDQEPSEKVWKNIAGSVSDSGRGWWNSVVIWRAAAIIFMAITAYLLVPKITGKDAFGPVAVGEPDKRTNTPNAELALREFTDVEAFYIQQISEKVDLIDAFQKNEGLNGFTQDFRQLEAMYMVLKEEIKTRPSKKVKDALVLNLLIRIDLLNQQISKLENEFEKKNKKDSNV